MRKIETQLLKTDERILKLAYLAERFKDEKINVPKEVLDYPTQDILTVICKYDNKYLIGKFKENYDFCPGDWDFLTTHLHGKADLFQQALQAPEQYVKLKSKKILRAYQSFLWLDEEFEVWWHFLPFLVLAPQEPLRTLVRR